MKKINSWILGINSLMKISVNQWTNRYSMKGEQIHGLSPGSGRSPEEQRFDLRSEAENFLMTFNELHLQVPTKICAIFLNCFISVKPSITTPFYSTERNLFPLYEFVQTIEKKMGERAWRHGDRALGGHCSHQVLELSWRGGPSTLLRYRGSRAKMARDNKIKEGKEG